MSKKIKLTVELEFSDKVYSDEDMEEVVNNVVDALVNQVDTAGLAPTESDAYTTAIRVSDNHGTERNFKFQF